MKRQTYKNLWDGKAVFRGKFITKSTLINQPNFHLKKLETDEQT